MFRRNFINLCGDVWLKCTLWYSGIIYLDLKRQVSSKRDIYIYISKQTFSCLQTVSMFFLVSISIYLIFKRYFVFENVIVHITYVTFVIHRTHFVKNVPCMELVLISINVVHSYCSDDCEKKKEQEKTRRLFPLFCSIKTTFSFYLEVP